MSIEHAIIARSRSHFVGMRAMEMLNREAFKGCSAELSNQPVSLEPAFVPAGEWRKIEKLAAHDSVAISPWQVSDLLRLNCLISSKHTLQWFRAERYVKELGAVSHRVGFEIVGNQDCIKIGFLVHKDDLDLLQVAFDGEFSRCKITRASTRDYFDKNLFFYDFFPSSPYHNLQTEPQELHASPYEPLIQAVAQLASPAHGFVQVLFEPVRHNWHQNVEILTDIEFLGKAIADPVSPYRTQQLPSGELRNMARKVETKAHDDKPFFFVALRVGIRTPKCWFNARPFTAFVGLLRRGGQPLQSLTETEYLRHFKSAKIQEMFHKGLTYRPGFLLNSSELSGFIHLPTIRGFIDDGLPIEPLETLRLPKRHKHLDSGIEIGTGWNGGSKRPVFINNETRKVSTHIVGKPGTGKTTTIEHMSHQDICAGRGVAYLDPHGDSVKRLLNFIPENRVESTIYIDFGDPDWVPLWNPLKPTPQQSIGRTTDDLVSAIKSVVKSNAWGDRLEHILRNGFYGLLHVENTTFFDLLVLFEQSKKRNGAKRDHLKKMILENVDNEVARMFWMRDYDGYKRDDFAPPLHKLSKLLTGDETVSLMLTQPESRIDFNEIMKSGKTLLLDLSNLGPDTRGILGCFLLSFLHHTSLSRNKIAPEDRRPFSIYCDEAHKLTTDTLEDMIAESRKFGVNLTLAHQFLNQFNLSQRDALSSVGTTIIFNVDINDARYLVKDLQGKVKPNDLATLKTGEAILRINTDIIKIKTPTPKRVPNVSFAKGIIKRSRENYCGRSNQVRESIQKKQNRFKAYQWSAPTVTEEIETTGNESPLSYDEFE
jgi:hypothetical protein